MGTTAWIAYPPGHKGGSAPTVGALDDAGAVAESLAKPIATDNKVTIMKIQLEKFGAIGAILIALATALPCCLPLLAATGAALGLSVLLPYQEYLNYALQAFVILALASHFTAYRIHHNHWLFSLSLISSLSIIIGYNFYYSANIIYPGLLGLGISAIWHYFISRSGKGCAAKKIILESIITCPLCGFQKTEIMPIDFCLFFYECLGCKALLKPKQGDCCVFCSYGSVKCPPIQTGSCSCI